MIIKDDDSPRNVWPIARVTKVFPDEQNLVRKVELIKAEPDRDSIGKRVKKASFLTRPIHKLVLLLSIDDKTFSKLDEEFSK